MDANNRAEITQRRIDGAVDGVGVIETASYKTMSTRSGLNASGKNCQSTDKSLATDVSTRVGNVLLKKCEAKDPIITRLRRLGVCPRRGKNNVICSTIADSDAKKTLLHPMRFNVPEGSITAILGTSESGKSTLMKFLAGCADSNLDCEGVGEQKLTTWCFILLLRSLILYIANNLFQLTYREQVLISPRKSTFIDSTPQEHTSSIMTNF
jgi:hypothetical protein